MGCQNGWLIWKKNQVAGIFKNSVERAKIKFELQALSTDRTGPLSHSLDFFCYVEYVMYVHGTWDRVRSLDKFVDRL